MRDKLDSDDDFLLNVYCSNRRDEVSAWGFAEEQAAGFLRMQYEMQKRHYEAHYPNSNHYIIVEEEHSAGRLIVDRNSNPWVLVDISILPNYQRKGIGSSLISQLIQELNQNRHMEALKLSVLRNSDALKLYERLGFEITDEQEIYYTMLYTKQGL